MTVDHTLLADVSGEISALAPETDRTASFPLEGLRIVHAAGLLEATVASQYGGQGASLLDCAHILATLSKGDPSVALISAMTLFNHLAQARRQHWPEDLYRQILANHPDQPLLLNAARVEPELGSPARGGLPQTIARRTANGWAITGTKRFVTGAEGLTYFLVWAHTDEVPARVGTFVVRNHLPGIEIIENWTSLGMRATGSHDVAFRNVEVPLDHVLDLTDPAHAEQDNRAGAANNLALTALYLGVAEAARDKLIAFGNARVPANLGRPIIETERFLNLLGEVDLAIGAARQLIFSALSDKQATAEDHIRARILAGRLLRDGVQAAVRGIGNPGLSAELGLERHYRDIQSVLVHAPQEDTGIAILGRSAKAAFQAQTNLSTGDTLLKRA